MKARNTKSLKTEIKQQISSRIFTSLGILLLIIISLSLFEFQGALKNIRQDVAKDVAEIEDFILSQVLVNNTAAIDLKLEEYQKQFPDRSIFWNVEESKIKTHDDMTFTFPFAWSYSHPIRKLSKDASGIIKVRGSLLEFENLVTEFMVRIALLLLFLGTICLLLLPLGKKIPKKLILDPLNEVLNSLRSHGRTAKLDNRYLEIDEINQKVTSLLSEREEILQRERELDKKLVAVETTQTLAHEVRRPFVKLKRTLDALEKIQDKQIFREFLTNSIPDLNHSLSSVSRKLTDLTNLGNPKPLQRQEVNAVELINSALKEACGLHYEKTVEIECRIDPLLMANIDFEKMHRVFSNLLENAMKLVNENGSIWIEANTNEFGTTQICIGNSDSFVPDGERENIFKLFYSSGQSHGSGIGLAVAKMHVEEHGGKIWCESNRDVGTEIFLTLPDTFFRKESSARTEAIEMAPQASHSNV